ncbi:AsmA-like C-terminal region-containing protein [Rufibacter sp. XAAS-G3-1]|uniref:AsmA-like C-terminal region-containing protein n=1 Tax=Rufibacter sp. XAAS-G3-1 TaxID=2729134 RepID=UPI0015E6BB5E
MSLQFRQHPILFKGFNGTLLLKKNDVAVSKVKGKIGDSDLLVNGYFKNALAWLFFKGQKLRIEADVASRFLNVNQILAASAEMGSSATAAPGEKGGSGAYAFNMPAQLELDLNTSVQRLTFRRFRGRQLSGRIQLKDKVLTTPGMAMQGVGGRFRVAGRMDARSPLIKVTSTAHLENINVDSLFYVFEDFGQTFIMQRHLRGELTAQITSDTYLDHRLRPRTDLVRAEVKTTLRNGQLINFAPMQKLSLFVKRGELANLRFSEMKNNFYIKNRIVYIPEMEIKSNTSRLSTITVSGTHTFDQLMDYRVRIPLKSQRRDKDERFGVIATSSANNPNLFLTIKGKEGNFKVAYDQQRVRQKVAADLKREKKVVKDILRGKKKEEEKRVKPSAEYFEF